MLRGSPKMGTLFHIWDKEGRKNITKNLRVLYNGNFYNIQSQRFLLASAKDFFMAPKQ